MALRQSIESTQAGPLDLDPCSPYISGLCIAQHFLVHSDVSTQYLIPLGVLHTPPVWEQNGVYPRTRTLCTARLLGFLQISLLQGLLDQEYMGTQGSKYTRVRSLGGDEAVEQAQEPSSTRIPGLGTLALSSLGIDLLIALSLHGIPIYPMSEVSTGAISLGRPPTHGAAGTVL